MSGSRKNVSLNPRTVRWILSHSSQPFQSLSTVHLAQLSKARRQCDNRADNHAIARAGLVSLRGDFSNHFGKGDVRRERQAHELVEAFFDIQDAGTRRAIIDFVKDVAHDDRRSSQ